MIVHEFAGAVRTIYMDKGSDRSAADSWMGWSHGRWEGDTLAWTRRASGFPPGSTAPATTTATRCTRSSATPRGPRDADGEVTIEDRKPSTRPEDEHAALPACERNAQLFEYLCVPFAEDLGSPAQAGATDARPRITLSRLCPKLKAEGEDQESKPISRAPTVAIVQSVIGDQPHHLTPARSDAPSSTCVTQRRSVNVKIEPRPGFPSSRRTRCETASAGREELRDPGKSMR